MEIDTLVKKIKAELEDVKEHFADYCCIENEDVEEILEYLEQLIMIRDCSSKITYEREKY